MPSKENPPASPPDENLVFLQKLLGDERIRAEIASRCEIRKSEHSEWSSIFLRAELGNPPNPGVLAFEFYPLWLGDWAKQKARAIADDMTLAMIGGLMEVEHISRAAAEEAVKRTGFPPPEYLDALAMQLAHTFTYRLARTLQVSLDEIETEVCCLIKGWQFKSNEIPGDDGVDEVIKAIVNRKQKIMKGAIASWHRPKWQNLKTHYDELYPRAKEMRTLYKQNRRRDWRAIVAAAGFTEFDVDLIDLLQKEVDLEAFKSKFGVSPHPDEDYSVPAHLALEQAARRCGMRPFRLRPRRLRELMHESLQPLPMIPKTLNSPNGFGSLKQPRKVKRKGDGVSQKSPVSRSAH